MAEVISFNKVKEDRDRLNNCESLEDRDIAVAEEMATEIAKHLAQTSQIIVDQRRADNILAHINYYLRVNYDLT